MPASFKQTAFSQLPPMPVNYTGDFAQVTQAISGIYNNVANWTLRVSNALNLLMPNGGVVPVSQGGTGAATFTLHGVLVGEGTSPIAATAAGASGVPLIGQGAAADPIFGTALVGGGGTGLTSGTSGGIPYFSSTSTMGSSTLLGANFLMLGGGAGVAPFTLNSLGTTTTVLHGNAAGAPTFGAVSLTTDVSGLLPVGSGGTGIGSGTSGGIPYFSSSSTIASSAALAANFLVLGGGAATAPLTDSVWNITDVTNRRLQANLNAAAAPGSVLSQGIYLSAGDTVNTGLMADTYANTTFITGRRANNTNASPQALALNDAILTFTCRGYGATGYSSGNRASIQLVANEAWSDTAQATKIVFNTVPTGGSVTAAAVATFSNQGCFLAGTNTSDNAGTGNYGEYTSSVILTANQITLTSNVIANITSISLTAGDWDVWGEVWFNPTTSGVTQATGAVHTTSAALPGVPADNTAQVRLDYTESSVGQQQIPLAPCRASLATTTSYFLNARAVFANTCAAYGKICARRRR